MLDDADQVVLVDLTPEELQLRLRAGKVYPGHQVEHALLKFFKHENLAALRELALREVAEDVEARRHPTVLDPTGEKPVAERILALITPQERSQRLMRRAWRSSQRLGAELDVLWVRRPDRRLTEAQREQLAALRRLGVVFGAHFLEEESEDFVEAVRAVASDRGSTYVFIGTPDSRRSEEVLRARSSSGSSARSRASTSASSPTRPSVLGAVALYGSTDARVLVAVRAGLAQPSSPSRSPCPGQRRVEAVPRGGCALSSRPYP